MEGRTLDLGTALTEEEVMEGCQKVLSYFLAPEPMSGSSYTHGQPI